jgi:hypothetical protein
MVCIGAVISVYPPAMQQIFAWIFLLTQLAVAGPGKGVAFEKEEFSFSADYTETVKEFDLPFTNHTDKAITVLKVETSCSCMKVSVEEPRVEPGKTGLVHCIVRIPDNTQTIDKTVLMQTDAPGGGLQSVRVRLEVPSILKLSTERLAWTIKAATEEKTVRIQIAEAAQPTKITKVECPGTLFEWTLKTIKEGAEYELQIHPKTTEKLAMGIFQIETDSPIQRHKRRSFFAVIEMAGAGK